MAFFEERGVPLKIEEDGRIFPKSNSSQSIIDCFLDEVERLNITILKNSSVKSFVPLEDADGWQITTMHTHYKCKNLLIATGSNPKIWNQLEKMGHSIIAPVPSLFTFNIKDKRIKGIQGVSTNVQIEIPPKKHYNSKIVVQLRSKVNEQPVLESDGPLLITHWGMSGPAILKLSAWGANILNEYNYNFRITINWLPEYTTEMLQEVLLQIKNIEVKKTILRTNAVDIPKRLWIQLTEAAGIDKSLKWADVTKEKLRELALQLTKCSFKVEGKSTFKEEFVTAGGVDLKEINFKTFESKKLPNLYFAGEIINVDAITGGFNFQNAWTGAYIAATAIASN
jgi:predicted Rossmann fold flavoprotein